MDLIAIFAVSTTVMICMIGYEVYAMTNRRWGENTPSIKDIFKKDR